MEQVINSIVDVMSYISGLGNVLMMPLVFTLLCLAFGMHIVDALRHSVRVGIGFLGFSLVNNMVIGTLGPAVTQMVENRGMNLNTLDIGWAAISTITYATEMGALIIIFGLIMNIALILLGLVRTLDVDLWNYWQWAFTGSFVILLTNNFWWGLAAAMIHEVFTLLVADASAEMVQEYIDMPDISIPHASSATMWFMALPLVKVWDLIGWKSRSGEKDPSSVNSFFSRLMDPILIGLAIGLMIGVLGYAGSGFGFRESFRHVLGVGMASAGMLVLMPKVVSILLDGINPISDQVREVLQRRLDKRGKKLYIGVDSAVMMQDQTSLIASMLMIPIILLLAAVLPGNTIIPFGGLTDIVFAICTIAPLVKGDLLKLIVTSTILYCILLLLGSNWAPEVTQLVAENGLALPDGAALVSFLGKPVTWIMVVLTRIF